MVAAVAAASFEYHLPKSLPLPVTPITLRNCRTSSAIIFIDVMIRNKYSHNAKKEVIHIYFSFRLTALFGLQNSAFRHILCVSGRIALHDVVCLLSYLRAFCFPSLDKHTAQRNRFESVSILRSRMLTGVVLKIGLVYAMVMVQNSDPTAGWSFFRLLFASVWRGITPIMLVDISCYLLFFSLSALLFLVLQFSADPTTRLRARSLASFGFPD